MLRYLLLYPAEAAGALLGWTLLALPLGMAVGRLLGRHGR